MDSIAPTLARIRTAVDREWRAILGDTPRQDAFDAAGGDSLGFLRLVFAVEQALDAALPIDLFHLGQTRSDIAAAIGRHLSGAPSPAATDRPRVFMVPVAGGDGPGQARFRAGCAPWIDIECVRLPHWTAIADAAHRFDDVANAVADQIEAASGPGPILLAGYCFGGAVAYAAARVLESRGRRIGFLGVVDADLAWFRRAPRSARNIAVSGIERIKSIRWAWQENRLPEHLAWLAAAALERRRGLLRRIAAARLRERLPTEFGFHLNLYLQMMLLPRTDRDGLIRAMTPAERGDFPIALFRVAQHPADRPDDLDWGSVAGPVQVVAIPGGHETLLDARLIGALCADFSGAALRAAGVPDPLADARRVDASRAAA